MQKILIANKCDLEDKRVVTKEEGEELAVNNGMGYFETSAKSNMNVDECFAKLVASIVSKIPICGLRKSSSKEKEAIEKDE